jgi:hypothetical protein
MRVLHCDNELRMARAVSARVKEVAKVGGVLATGVVTGRVCALLIAVLANSSIRINR